ncbi:peptidase inhibitor family I36 protein [Streptomyces sp. CWNU-52H]
MTLAVGAALIAAPSASAAESDCPSGQICLFKDYNYGGSMLWISRFGTSDSDLKREGFNDVASSVVNNASWSVRLYQDVYFGGKYIDVAPGQRIANLSSVPIYNADGSYFGVNTFNDRISSTQ